MEVIYDYKKSPNCVNYDMHGIRVNKGVLQQFCFYTQNTYYSNRACEQSMTNFNFQMGLWSTRQVMGEGW